MIQNPWKTLNSKLIYENPWIRVREDQVIHPNGKPGIFGIVESQKIASGVLALTENDELYLVGQYRYALNAYSWEIVEGGIERNEEPVEGIKRELREEAGLEASHWEFMTGPIHLSNCVSDEYALIFIARGLTQVESNPDDGEKLQVKKVPFSEAVQMVLRGEITDAMSIVAILHYSQKMKGI